MLVNDWLTLKMCDGIMDIRPAIACDEKRSIRLFGNMLDVDVIAAMLTEALQNHISLLRGFQRVHKWIFPAREIIDLDVNN